MAPGLYWGLAVLSMYDATIGVVNTYDPTIVVLCAVPRYAYFLGNHDCFSDEGTVTAKARASRSRKLISLACPWCVRPRQARPPQANLPGTAHSAYLQFMPGDVRCSVCVWCRGLCLCLWGLSSGCCRVVPPFLVSGGILNCWISWYTNGTWKM